MVQRIIIGNHPTGHKGLFISKPGYDAGLQDPNDRNAWLFSSNWSRIGSILGSGTCTRGQRVYHYNPGYQPQVYFEAYNGDTNVGPSVSVTTTGSANSNSSTIEIYNTFVCNHYGWDQFQIDRQIPVSPDNDATTFRYFILAIPF